MGSNSETEKTEKREDHTTNLYLFICMKISLKLLLIPNDEGLANTVIPIICTLLLRANTSRSNSTPWILCQSQSATSGGNSNNNYGTENTLKPDDIFQ